MSLSHPPMTVRMRCIPSLHLIFVCPAIQGMLAMLVSGWETAVDPLSSVPPCPCRQDGLLQLPVEAENEGRHTVILARGTAAQYTELLFCCYTSRAACHSYAPPGLDVRALCHRE